jgi:hypothetical protein
MSQENVNEYDKKIKNLLDSVLSGKETQPEPLKKESIDDEKFKKIKEIGIKKAIETVFLEEFVLNEVPMYVTEETDEQLVGTEFFRIKPPSSYPDADEYWKKMLPFLKRIGKFVTYTDEGPGSIDLKVINQKGNEEVLRIQLVRDASNGDKPTLTFEFLNNNELSAEEVIKFAEKVGLKPDRLNAKCFNGVVVLDLFDN